jgi:hypothetical protein
MINHPVHAACGDELSRLNNKVLHSPHYTTVCLGWVFWRFRDGDAVKSCSAHGLPTLLPAARIRADDHEAPARHPYPLFRKEKLDIACEGWRAIRGQNCRLHAGPFTINFVIFYFTCISTVQAIPGVRFHQIEFARGAPILSYLRIPIIITIMRSAVTPASTRTVLIR